MSEVKVNKISPRSGTTVTLGDSGDTFTLASGVSLTGVNATFSGDLTVNTDALKVDSTNKFVGIGTASPAEELSIHASIPTIELTDTDGTNQTGYVYESSGNLIFQSQNDTANGKITLRRYDGSTLDNTITMDSGGGLLLGTTSAGSAVKGDIVVDGNIYLGGTGSANALDDYEEGTFTPVIADATSGGNTSPTSFTGQYTKIGSLVCVGISCFNIDKTGLTAGNNLYIRGLPFPVKSGINYQGACTLDRVNFTGFVSAQFDANTSYVNLKDMIDSTFEAILKVSDIITSGGSDITISATYLTDS